MNETKTDTTASYEERYVAFLDILGWKKAVHSSLTDSTVLLSLGDTLTGIGNMAKHVGWFRQQGMKDGFGDIHYAQFSDSVLVSGLVNASSGLGLIHFCQNVSSLIYVIFVNFGFVIRGGITSGPIYHRESIAFGPAVEAAYNLEQCAVYPRVVIDPKIMVDSVTGPTPRLRTEFSRLDVDGFRYVNFLQPSQQWMEDPEHPPPPQRADMERSFLLGALTDARKRIVHRLEEHRGDPKTRAKYRWLATYFNQLKNEKGITELEDIA